jgi:hypothetical protein
MIKPVQKKARGLSKAQSIFLAKLLDGPISSAASHGRPGIWRRTALSLTKRGLAIYFLPWSGRYATATITEKGIEVARGTLMRREDSR